LERSLINFPGVQKKKNRRMRKAHDRREEGKGENGQNLKKGLKGGEAAGCVDYTYSSTYVYERTKSTQKTLGETATDEWGGSRKRNCTYNENLATWLQKTQQNKRRERIEAKKGN